MTRSRVAALALFLFGVMMWLPLSGKAQTATPWTAKQCRDRMNQLYEIGNKASDPLVDLNDVLRELMQDIGDRAGSSFAIYCRMKEANSISSLQHRMKSIEADRQETANSADREKKASIKWENFNVQNPSYNPGYINVFWAPAN